MELNFAVIFLIGFLSGLSIAILLIFTTSLGDKIFDKLFQNLSKKVDQEAKKTLSDIEQLKSKEIESAVNISNSQAKGAMTELVKNESAALKKLIEDANKALEQANTTWKTENNKSLEEVRNLNESFIRWHNSLTNPVKQGSESEMALESLLDSIGFIKNVTYKTQVVRENEEGKTYKPDVFVKTKGNRWFVIDSKAPMTAFDKYVLAESEPDKKSSLKELGSNFKSHIKDLGKKKYQELDNKTPPFTVMFVPNAALYLTVMNEVETDILELSRENNVFVTPPAMVIPILQMFNEGLLEEDFESKKDDFRSLIKKLIEAIGYLDKHFLDAEKGIDKAKSSLIKFRNSWNTYLPARSRDLINQQKIDVEEIKQLEVVDDEENV